jgi:hypothetical protein
VSAVQYKQRVDTKEPLISTYKLAAQLTRFAGPVALWYLPELHGVHALALEAEKVPMARLKHELLSVFIA